MNAKKPLSASAIVIAAIVALAIVGFIGFRSLNGAAPQAASAPEMYGHVAKLAVQSGGDYTKLAQVDQQYLEHMSHGHGKKLLEAEYARATKAPRGQ